MKMSQDALTKDRLDEAVKVLGDDLKGKRDRALLLLTWAWDPDARRAAGCSRTSHVEDER
jgi:hypothetical protein